MVTLAKMSAKNVSINIPLQPMLPLGMQMFSLLKGQYCHEQGMSASFR